MTYADDSQAKRAVLILVIAQSILGAQMPMIFTIGGLAGQMLAPNPCLATLPISCVVLGSMIASTQLSNFMQNNGRRAGFWLGTLGGAGGALVCAIALWYGSFGMFLVGSFLSGIYMSAQGFYRFAAADMASEGFRAKAISYVMAAGLITAVIGPQLVKLTTSAMVVPFMGVYLAIVVLNILGATIFFALHIPKPAPPSEHDKPARTWGELLRTPRILVAIICGMVSYALMNLVMTSTPLAVVGCGFSQGNAADIVMSHVLAMFAPSFFTGHLINRFGAEKIIGAGLLTLLAAGLVGLSDVELLNFYVALVLLGVGWNFGFIGATTMLASSHGVHERGRVQGLNDLCVFGMVTVASLASGGLMNCSGGSPVEGWNAVNYAMAPFLLLAGGSLIWLALRKPDPA